MLFEKTIEVKRNSSLVPVKINISNKNLEVNVEGEIMFIDLCRYLLEHTPILQTRYARKSPYKLKIEKVHDWKSFLYRSYSLDYLEVKDRNVEEKAKHLINLLGCNAKVSGKIEIFTPDLLLVMNDRGYVSNTGDTFKQSRKFNTEVEFKEVSTLPSPEKLKQSGYTIPTSYEQLYFKISK